MLSRGKQALHNVLKTARKFRCLISGIDIFSVLALLFCFEQVLQDCHLSLNNADTFTTLNIHLDQHVCIFPIFIGFFVQTVNNRATF